MYDTAEYDDLLSMLKNLGFKKAEAQKRAAWAIEQAGEDAALDVLVKLALQTQAANSGGHKAAQRPPPRSLVRIPEVLASEAEEDDEMYAEDEEQLYADYEEEPVPPPPPRQRRQRSAGAGHGTRSSGSGSPAPRVKHAPITLPVEASPNSNYYITVVYECAHGSETRQPRRRREDYPEERLARAYGQDSRGRPQLTLGRLPTSGSISSAAKSKKDDIFGDFNWHLALTFAAGVIVLKWLNIL